MNRTKTLFETDWNTMKRQIIPTKSRGSSQTLKTLCWSTMSVQSPSTDATFCTPVDTEGGPLNRFKFDYKLG